MNKNEIIDWFENTACFRDYSFRPESSFGRTNIKASINLLNPDEHALHDALDVFSRDGYSRIVVYLTELDIKHGLYSNVVSVEFKRGVK